MSDALAHYEAGGGAREFVRAVHTREGLAAHFEKRRPSLQGR